MSERMDVDLIGRALRATAGVMGLGNAERVAEERLSHGVPMEELIDWLYEWRGDAGQQLHDCVSWLSSVRRARDRVKLAAHPCAFCGDPGAVICDFRVGFGRSAMGHADTTVAFTCDLVVCDECKGADECCPFHEGKEQLTQALSLGGAMSILRQLQWFAKQARMTPEESPFVSKKRKPAGPAQAALFEMGAEA